MTEQILHFLLVFDHPRSRLIEIGTFGRDAEAAVAAYGEKEDLYRERQRIEVVLVGSDSLETVRRTHANYFDGDANMSKYFAGI